MTRLNLLIEKSREQETPSLFEDVLSLCQELEEEVSLLKELLELKEEREQIESENEKLRKILAELKKGE